MNDEELEDFLELESQDLIDGIAGRLAGLAKRVDEGSTATLDGVVVTLLLHDELGDFQVQKLLTVEKGNVH